MLPLSRRAERAAQAFRVRLIDLIRGRDDLAVLGHLTAQRQAVQAAESRRLAARRALDRAERRAGLGLSLGTAWVAAAALGLGIAQAQTGTLAPERAALAFFVALALAEALAPLRRALADLGRVADAARRLSPDLSAPDQPEGPAPGAEGALTLDRLTLARPGGGVLVSDLSLTLQPGQTLALTGPSGAGKSTLLLALAGLHPPAAGQVLLGQRPLGDWPENALRGVLTLLPQRSALMAGTVAEALTLSTPASDADLLEVLRAVQLEAVLAPRGGLSARIGPRGSGLSGGEGRRLALARALLRRPQVLLLDEPTEGLDDPTARAVLAGIRAFLPQAALVIAAHRPAEIDGADRVIALR